MSTAQIDQPPPAPALALVITDEVIRTAAARFRVWNEHPGGPADLRVVLRNVCDDTGRADIDPNERLIRRVLECLSSP